MSNPTRKDDNQQSPASGAYTLAEILSQAECWARCLGQLESGEIVGEIERRFGNAPEWIFVGCGSSYYLGLSAAASWTAITGKRARTVPASELLFFPDSVLAGATEFVPVLISRSGLTSEVVRAAQFFNERKVPTLAVTCAAGQKLASMATVSLLLPEADEQSMVMTRSVTSMLLGLEYAAAALARRRDLLESLRSLPTVTEKVLEDLPIRVREFVSQHQFSHYVFLGQGPYYGLACESALKVMEMSRSYAQAFHTLEFRHGPKATVGGETLITFLLSEANYEAEVEVLKEMKALGAVTLVVGKEIDDRARADADLIVELACSLPEPTCLPAFLPASQLLGFYTALQKGLDPDRPANLSRVVLLEEENELPQNARV